MPSILGLHFSVEKASLIVITGDDARIWLSQLTYDLYRLSLYFSIKGERNDNIF